MPEEPVVEYVGEVEVASDAHHATVPVMVADLARRMGFDRRSCCELQIVVGEMCANILSDAGSGVVRFGKVIEPLCGVFVAAEDDGPGFEDIDLACCDGVSRGRALAEVPHHERGSLGTGLGAMQRLTDYLHIANHERGAYVVVFKELQPR